MKTVIKHKTVPFNTYKKKSKDIQKSKKKKTTFEQIRYHNRTTSSPPLLSVNNRDWLSLLSGRFPLFRRLSNLSRIHYYDVSDMDHIGFPMRGSAIVDGLFNGMLYASI